MPPTENTSSQASAVLNGRNSATQQAAVLWQADRRQRESQSRAGAH